MSGGEESSSEAPAATARAARCGPQSLTAFAPCGPYVAVHRPRGCPFQSRPAPQPRTTPASTGGAAGTARRPLRSPSRARSRAAGPLAARATATTAAEHDLFIR